jgi:antitoxin component of MazEF toxin-antitoxin module
VFQERIRKDGDEFVVTVPESVMLAHGFHVGQLVRLQIAATRTEPVLRPEVRKALEESWAQSEAAYRYLADH